jgi:hypothetical protein
VTRRVCKQPIAQTVTQTVFVKIITYVNIFYGGKIFSTFVIRTGPITNRPKYNPKRFCLNYYIYFTVVNKQQ